MKLPKTKKIILLLVLYLVVVMGFLATLIIFSGSDIYDKKNLSTDIVKACVMGLGIFVYDIIKFLKRLQSNKSNGKLS